MGIYSMNRTVLSENDFIADESYANAFGAYRMMIEAKNNDLTLFNNVIQLDFQEAYANISGDEALMESVIALQEAGAAGIWQSLIDLLKKIGNKIKAIFDKFIAKLNGMFTKDTKALLKKYESKFSSAYLSKMSLKGYKPILDSEPMDYNVFNTNFIKDKVADITNKTSSDDISKATSGNGRELDFLTNCLKGSERPKFTSSSDFRDYLDKKMFGMATDAEGAVAKDKDKILEVLRNNKIISQTEKDKNKILKDIKELIREYESQKKEAEKAEVGTGDGKVSQDDKNLNLAKANASVIVAQNAQSAVTTAFSAYSQNLKSLIAQCKKALVAGATFQPKGEASELWEAQLDVVEEEVLLYFNED